MKSISSEGGVGGRVLLLREGCETCEWGEGEGERVGEGLRGELK